MVERYDHEIALYTGENPIRKISANHVRSGNLLYATRITGIEL